MKRAAPIAYLVVLHGLLALALWQPAMVESSRLRLGLGHQNERFVALSQQLQANMDPGIPDGAAIFLGDSITYAMPVAAVAPNAVNLGVPSQTAEQLLATLPRYGSLRRASVIFLTIGTNDVRDHEGGMLPERFDRILAALPPDRPLVWSAIPPRRVQDASAIREANRHARDLCNRRQHCTFVDTWEFLANPDGSRVARLYADTVHPNASGYALWVFALREVAH